MSKNGPGSLGSNSRRSSESSDEWSKFGSQATGGVTPDVPGVVCAWLVTDPAAAEPNGRTVHAPTVCEELGLLPKGVGIV